MRGQCGVFLVEDIERRQADVGDFFLAESDFVRINDRGPFIAGRSVDVSYSAAERIGILDRGVAKVKLDVVQ